MHYLLIGLKSFLVFLLIPLALGIYIEKVRAAEGTKAQRLLAQNWHWLLVLLIVVGGGIFLEVWFFPKEKRSEDRAITFLELEHYQKELEDYNKSNNPTNWDTSKAQLVRKFKHVTYALGKEDYQEAINTLHQMRNANDSYGKLLHIESYTVLNNLGVAYFKLQKNKDFNASWYLQLARSLAETRSVDVQPIANNIKALDAMLNDFN